MPSAAERVGRIEQAFNSQLPTPLQVQNHIGSQREKQYIAELNNMYSDMGPAELAECIGLDESVGLIKDVFYNGGNPRVKRNAEKIDRFVEGIEELRGIFDSYTEEEFNRLLACLDPEKDIQKNGRIKLERIQEKSR